MGKLIIDAHSHLWLKQDTTVDGKRILSLKNGRSIFMDEEVQMLPPFMIDGQNTAEVFLSNMNYAQVGAAVVVQEVIDGCQNAYLTKVQQQYPDRFFCMGMAWNTDEAQAVIDAGLKGIAFPGHRIHESLLTLMPVFKLMESKEMVLSMCLADDEEQIGQMAEVIQECPDLKVAIGHFGMPSTASFRSQVLLARQGRHVMVESGGITWLYNSEFYPFPTAIRRIREAADLVGMERLMWGSDYPRTITAITYRMSYDFVEKSSELTDSEKAMFLGGNAKSFYGFENLPELPYIKNMSE
ncbi:amidohydrolase [Prevotella communis]|uniref:amidohydrolase family protein n=1 Tax=Prevotella communis TaxID=2913614 RepID=UPI001EDBB368|nr:amidohydrolase family protein [Prevotella communis]UKK60999.1 amidohydrolase [Prevotella communis]UKK63825.1 amidohydrolase [Prevotella communis]